MICRPNLLFYFPCDWLHGLHLGRGGGILIDLSRRWHLLGVTSIGGRWRELVCLLGRLRRYPANVSARSTGVLILMSIARPLLLPTQTWRAREVQPYSWDVELAVRLLRHLCVG